MDAHDLIRIENAAHEGAFGHNTRPIPTPAQCNAGNYKVGRTKLYGLPLAIEQPRGSLRTGIGPDGKRWASLMTAHYGYIIGTKGNDGDGVDCFIGTWPGADRAYIINQHLGGHFDEHKVMLGYPDAQSASTAYLGSYERGWPGLGSVVEATIPQLKAWLKTGDMSRPVTPKNLPYEGLEAMTKSVYWDSAAMPIGMTLDAVLYDLRRSDSGENLLLDSLTPADILEDADSVMALDAMVVPFANLEPKMNTLRAVMDRASPTIRVAAQQVTQPFKQAGVTQVAAIFELSDGQTVSVYFHNPDTTPNKLAPADVLTSWAWRLNKKDITIVVAPEKGADLNIREVARRIMKLAEKNSPAFARANTKRAEYMAGIKALQDEIVGLEGELSKALSDLEVAKLEADDRAAKKAAQPVPPEPTSAPSPTPAPPDRSGTAEEQAAADAALAMAAGVVSDLGGTFEAAGFSGYGTAGAWSYGKAVVNGKDVDLAASGGGVVQVNRKPHDPQGNTILTAQQVRESILAVAPAAPGPMPEPESETDPEKLKKNELKEVNAKRKLVQLYPFKTWEEMDAFRNERNAANKTAFSQWDADIQEVKEKMAEIKAATTPPVDEKRSASIAMMQAIIDGTTDPLTADLDALEAAFTPYQDDAEVSALFERAVDVVLQAEAKATEGV